MYAVLLLGFASLFYTLESGAGVWVFLQRIHMLFMVALGDIDFEEFSSEMRPGFEPLSNLFLLLHVILVTIMLLNLLIAMVGDEGIRFCSLFPPTLSHFVLCCSSHWHRITHPQ